MASLVGAILFLLPFTLPIFHSHLPLPISHFQFPTPQAATRCCRIVFHAGSPAERQLFRTDFRFAPSPRCASLAGPPIHEGHGRPRSVRKSYRLRCKSFSMDCICSDRRKSFCPSAPVAYAISVSPLNEAVAWPGAQVLGAGGCCRLAGDAGVGCRIRLTHGLVRRSCNSPRTRILVLCTSRAHWPARWPQFVLTEHGPKS